METPRSLEASSGAPAKEKRGRPAPQVTYHTRLRLDDETAKRFEAYGEWFGLASRQFHRLMDLGVDLLEAKRAFIRTGLTARQFNSIRFEVDGKRASLASCRKLEIADKKRRMVAIEKRLLRKEDSPSGVHQKKRRWERLRARLERLEKSPPKRVFGGQKLWKAQHHLEENGYASHEEWRSEWRKARSGQFTFVGSKDETWGNQSCQYHPALGTLDVRLPDRLGGTLRIETVRFPYGGDELRAAILSGQAVSYRFVRKEKGWVLFASTRRTPVPLETSLADGAMGVDVGPSRIAWVMTDGAGHPIARRTLRVDLVRKRRSQVRATLEELAVQIVDQAKKAGTSIVMENLDFSAKKAELRERGKGYARRLSGFAYQTAQLAIESRAWRSGVGVLRVHPAFTSVIGIVKFGAMYGMSGDEAAALGIARRGMNLKESVPARTALRRPEDRRRHVWRIWARFGEALRATGRHAFLSAVRGPGGAGRRFPALPARASPGTKAPGPARGKSLGLRVRRPARTEE